MLVHQVHSHHVLQSHSGTYCTHSMDTHLMCNIVLVVTSLAVREPQTQSLSRSAALLALQKHGVCYAANGITARTCKAMSRLTQIQSLAAAEIS